MKHFTVAEAEALIPELEKIFAAARKLASKAQEKAHHLRDMENKGEGAAAMAIGRSQLQFLANGVNQWLRKIEDLGGQAKGLSPALVDFPHRLNGRDVYLCWQLGDKKIGFYHPVEEGFAGRKPLPSKKP